jgi:hypothetical protein
MSVERFGEDDFAARHAGRCQSIVSGPLWIEEEQIFPILHLSDGQALGLNGEAGPEGAGDLIDVHAWRENAGGQPARVYG